MHIARDCLANRQRRIDYDLVQDAAEKELLKEIELISQVQVDSFIIFFSFSSEDLTRTP